MNQYMVYIMFELHFYNNWLYIPNYNIYQYYLSKQHYLEEAN